MLETLPCKLIQVQFYAMVTKTQERIVLSLGQYLRTTMAIMAIFLCGFIFTCFDLQIYRFSNIKTLSQNFPKFSGHAYREINCG